MNDRCAQIAFPVISYGLSLADRGDRGTPVDVAREQAKLKDLLLADEADNPHAEENGGKRFLGIRYALVCWLDELFTARGQWASAWNEHKLEVELYGSNDRAWKFWDQARLAQTRPTTDALEVFYLCVMLGFRGALAEQPEQLSTWLAASRQRLGQVQERDLAYGSEIAPTITAPPLRGAARLRQMALTGWVVMLIVGPMAAFYGVHRLVFDWLPKSYGMLGLGEV